MLPVLTIKLMRDLWRYAVPNLAIALIVACGVASQVTAFSLIHSLESALENYYSDSRFADLFVQVADQPLNQLERLREIDGVVAVQPRLVAEGSLSIEEQSNARAIAAMIAVPSDVTSQANTLVIRQGVGLADLAQHQVIVSEVSAEARQLTLGREVELTLDGRVQRVTVAGIAISPEYVFQIREGDGIPDNSRYAIVWMRLDGLEKLSQRQGIVNQVCMRVRPGISMWQVRERVEQIMGRGQVVRISERSDQISHRYTANAVRQLYSVATVPPSLFFAVAAFQVTIAMARLLKSEREDIAIQRAFGYSRWAVAMHYLRYILAVTTLGSLIGIVMGGLLASHAIHMYGQLYRFPELPVRLSIFAVCLSVIISTLIAIAGGAYSIIRMASYPPSLTLRPEAPASYRWSWLDTVSIRIIQQPIVQLAIRSLLRWKVRTALGIAGLALGVGVMILGAYTQAAVAYVIDYEFFFTRRYDLAVQFAPGVDHRALTELQHAPGVLACEPIEVSSATLKSGNNQRVITLTGLDAAGELVAPRTSELEIVPLFRGGLALSEQVAQSMAIAVGDLVELEFSRNAKQNEWVRVTSIFRDYSGMNAYAKFDDLQSWLHTQRFLSAVVVRLDPAHSESTTRTLADLPRVRSVHRMSAMIDSFRENDEKNLLVFRLFNILFSSVIGVCAVYSVASISVIERKKDLAMMRVLGYTPIETGLAIIGEMLIMLVIALPLGCAAGWAFAALATWLLNSETQRIPMLVSPQTYFSAMLVSLASFSIACVLIMRLIYRLDCVSILKSGD